MECYIGHIVLQAYFYEKERRRVVLLYMMIAVKTLVLTYFSSLTLALLSELALLYTQTEHYHFFRHERAMAILQLFVVFTLSDGITLLAIAHFFVIDIEALLEEVHVFSLLYRILPRYVSYLFMTHFLMDEEIAFDKGKMKQLLLLFVPFFILMTIYVLSVFGFAMMSTKTMYVNLMLLIVMFGFAHLFYYVRYLSKKLAKQKPIEAVEDKGLEEMRRLRHDLRHEWMLIYKMIEEKEFEKAKRYIEKQISVIERVGRYVKTGYTYVDQVINGWIEKMRKSGVDIKVEGEAVDIGRLDEMELGVVLSNALENAYEGMEASREKRCRIKIYEKEGALCVRIDNSMARKKGYQEGKSDKKEKGHGYGSRTIHGYVRKYHGKIEIRHDRYFSLFFSIPK